MPQVGVDDTARYVAVGEVVAGKYLVERTLGAGGMAFVLSARHLDLDEHFALKFLNRNLLRERSVVERFMREAKAACKIQSEHVARVYDVGTHDGAPFIVMEHLSGRDLATVVQEEGALRIDDAVEYTLQTCEALAAAHSLGIVHRDIKPENLFLVTRDEVPSVKLLDFGISKSALTGEPSSRLTGALTLGTPCYMSPEQIRSTTSADAQSDLWSLAAVLYELLTGVQAFEAATVTEICAAVLESSPLPIRELRPEVPEELAMVVATAMEKDRTKRFASVRDLAAALLPFAPHHAQVAAERSSLTIRHTSAPKSSQGHLASHTPTSWTPTTQIPKHELLVDADLVGPAPTGRGRWRRITWVAAGAACLVLLGFAGARTHGVGTATTHGGPALGAAVVPSAHPSTADPSATAPSTATAQPRSIAPTSPANDAVRATAERGRAKPVVHASSRGVTVAHASASEAVPAAASPAPAASALSPPVSPPAASATTEAPSSSVPTRGHIDLGY